MQKENTRNKTRT